MALVIDDRLKVWDEKDQPRVHVVPAFAPYYAPQAEVNFLSCIVGSPILSIARMEFCLFSLYELIKPVCLVGKQYYPCPMCCKKCCLQC